MAQSLTRTGASLTMKIVRYWLPVIIMLATMYYLSTDLFSGENTRTVFELILGWFNASSATIIKVNHLTRKTAHFLEYAVLALLLFRAFRAGSSVKWRFAWALYSMAIVASWALLDEYHQSFTQRRGASFYDSLLDSSGALFALTLLGLVSRRKRKRRVSAGPCSPSVRSRT